MRQKSEIAILLVALVVVGIVAGPTAMAQNAALPSLKEQLEAQYQLAKLADNSGQTTVAEPGTVLVIQKDGIFGVPHASTAVCPSRYQDGKVDSPDALCPATVKKSSRPFKVGEKAYPSKIDVDLKKEKISFDIIACDACNGTNPPTSFRSEVIFQFAKGYLEKASVPEVEDTIGEVLAVDNSSAAQAPQPTPSEPGEAGPTLLTNDMVIKMAGAKLGDAVILAKIKTSQCNFDTSTDALINLKQAGVSDAVVQAMVEVGGAPATETSPNTAVPAQPMSPIQLGMTPEQVKATLGPPQRGLRKVSKIDPAESTMTYFYKDIRVTFVNDKVTDVQGRGGPTAEPPGAPPPPCADYQSCFEGGRAALTSSQWDSSLADLQKASSLDPSKPDPWAELGKVYLATGQYQDAVAMWDKALGLGGTLALDVWALRGMHHEKGIFSMSAKEVSYVGLGKEMVFSVAPAEVTRVTSAKVHMSGGCWWFCTKVGGKNHCFYHIPLGAACKKSAFKCEEPGPSQMEAVAKYVAQTIGRLASGGPAK